MSRALSFGFVRAANGVVDGLLPTKSVGHMEKLEEPFSGQELHFTAGTKIHRFTSRVSNAGSVTW